MPLCTCGHSADAHPDELFTDGPDEDTVFPCVYGDCPDYDPVV